MNKHKSNIRVGHGYSLILSGLRRLPSKKPGILALLAGLLVAGFVVVTFVVRARIPDNLPGKSATAARLQVQQPNPLANLPPPDMLRPLTAQEAVAANATKPIIRRSDDPAAIFKLSGDVVSKGRALECLTQAVYYEAASEGVDGGRAVAQIVLNRVHHPGYPSSVCGVVFQNSERTTGCQFSFTCNGSLARIPVPYIWARSRVIASEALAGRVFAPVGHATHYHADYVLPYWADSLDKVTVIGRHIFYRLRGASGSRSFFSQRYSGNEPMPLPPPLSEMTNQALNALAENPSTAPLPNLPKVEEDRLQTLEKAAIAETQIKIPLAADSTRGQLILGERGTAPKLKPKLNDECGAGGVSRIKPIGAENLTTGLGKQIC